MTEDSHSVALTEQLSRLAQDLESSELVLTKQASDNPSGRTLTRMELIQIILSLQEIQNIQMDRLQDLVDHMDPSKENQEPTKQSMTTTFAASTANDAPLNTAKPASLRHWSVGRPLETLIESEQESENTKALSKSSGKDFSHGTSSQCLMGIRTISDSL
jgi:hypothetical protein